MSDIFREVDEAIQREKAAKLWQEYGPTLLLAAVVLIVSTGVVTAYRSWDSNQDKKETAELIAASMEQGEKITPALEAAAKETRNGHRGVALMTAAGQYAAEKNFTKSSELYNEIAADKGITSDFRDLAVILGGRSDYLAGKSATDDYKKQIDRLLPITKNDKSAFQYQAKLEAALLYGDGLKDYKTALDLLKGMGEASANDSLREKATALQHVYEYEVSQSAKGGEAAKTNSAPTPSKN